MTNKILSFLLCLALTVPTFCTGVLADGTEQETEAQPAQIDTVEKTLSFDKSTVIRDSIPMAMYGYNHSTQSHMMGGDSVLANDAKFLAITDKEKYNDANPDAVESLKGYPLCHIRYGGTGANYYWWKEDLGPTWQKAVRSQKDKRYVGYGHSRLSVGDENINANRNVYKIGRQQDGIDENIRIMLAYGGENMTFTYTLNVVTEPLADMVDMVEFLTSDGTVNYNGGENWGKLRKERYGIDKLNIVAWELGNEVDLSKMSIDEYIETIKKAVPAIRTVDKKTPIAAHIASNDTASAGVEWQRKLLMECGDIIDYIVIHKYFTTNQVSGVCENSVRALISDIEKFGDPERHKILFTEYNTGWITDRADWPKNTDISSAVTIADYMIRMMHYPQIIEADFHCFSSGGGNMDYQKGGRYLSELRHLPDSGPWWAFYVDDNKVVRATAPVEVLKVFCDNSKGAKMIGANLQDFKPGSVAMSTAAAFEQSDGDVCIFITNFNENSNLTVNLENEGYYLKQDTRIYGTNGLHSMNFRGHEEVKIETKDYIDKSECRSYTLSPMSFAMIRLSRIK